MVRICTQEYTEENLELFQNYNFELHPFQKWNIFALVNNYHTLITSHTGGGKTLCCFHPIEDAVKRGKKVIYTSPVKALTNQKYNEFTKKYPHISFGIITGDIPNFNTDADVILMTAEILRNILLNGNKNTYKLNIELNDIEYIIHDEIHYLNDSGRGSSYEQMVLLTPKHVRLIMLSATIDKPEVLAQWIEKVTNREVYLTGTKKRLIPLEYYSYITCPNVKNQEIQKKCQKKIFLMKDVNNSFNRENYLKLKDIKNTLNKEKIQVSKPLIVNELVKFLFTHVKTGNDFEPSETNEINLFPAIYFVFSRKQTEYLASIVNISLFGDGSNDQIFCYEVEKRCREILSSKLTNFEEYMNLPEFLKIKKLLTKGVCYHHSGCIPIFKEMIEILFSEGKIKLLFSTETLSVGINMSVRAVIFDSFYKFDSNGGRLLLPSEVTQIAGRSGRQGIDKKGVIFYIANSRDFPLEHEFNNLLNGPPQSLTSKFKITYNLLLSFEDNGELINFINSSMVSSEQGKMLIEFENELELLNKISYEPLTISEDIIFEYSKLDDKNGNQRKKIQKMIETYPGIDKDIKIWNSIRDNKHKKELINDKINSLSIDNILYPYRQILNKFLCDGDNIKSHIASNIHEFHPLAFTDLLIKSNFFDNLTAIDLICVFSCLTDFSFLKEEVSLSSIIPSNINLQLKNTLIELEKEYKTYIDMENKFKIYDTVYPALSYDLILPIQKWCSSENMEECNMVIGELGVNTGEIFLGEFIKTMLKIKNISNDLYKLAIDLGKITFAQKLEEIPNLIMKYIIINQSLYI